MIEELPKSANEMTDILDVEGLFWSSLPDAIRLTLLILLILLAMIFVIYVIKKIAAAIARKKESQLTPEEKALKYLEALKKKNMIDQHQWRPFYFLLDGIYRRYLFEKFDFDVLDRTFEELKAKIDMFSNFLTQTELNWTKNFWARAQMSKFAGQNATPDDALNDFKAVHEFVKRTKGLSQNG